VSAIETSGKVFYRAERKVIDAGYGPARLPGQYLTEKRSVCMRLIPDTNLATWDFLSREPESPLRLSDEPTAPRTRHGDIHASPAGAAST
jgi:hypothetical protein